MASQDVILMEVGRPAWRRWMILHRENNRYWSQGSLEERDGRRRTLAQQSRG